jgi:hypothetical protein
MKAIAIKPMLGCALVLAAFTVNATGLVTIPNTGFIVSGGTSAYTLCNTSGNFGAVQPVGPTTSANNSCAVFPATDAASPVAGFTLITTASRPVVMNNTYTGGANITVATLTDYVWRNAVMNECIYGAKVVMNSNDYDVGTPLSQYMNITDLARGGFSGRPVSAGYSSIAAAAWGAYRVGRSFTSVNHEGLGAVDQPFTTPAFSLSINAAQSASINDNWVDFTTDIFYARPEGVSGAITAAASSSFYIKSTCSSAAPVAVANAIRLRQAMAPYIEVSVTGFAPPAASALPAPVTPY